MELQLDKYIDIFNASIEHLVLGNKRYLLIQSLNLEYSPMVENECGRSLTWLMWTSLVSPSSVDTMMYSGSSGGNPVTRPGWRKLICFITKQINLFYNKTRYFRVQGHSPWLFSELKIHRLNALFLLYTYANTDGQTSIVTTWAPVGAKNKYDTFDENTYFIEIYLAAPEHTDPGSHG